ncbi:MAG: Eco57I restriction-modification methylase domain-containing protein [Pseudonocardia sp.]
MALEAGSELVEFGGQLSLMDAPSLAHDPAAYLVDADGEHGEVFTRAWVVGLILDLVGYTPDRDLAALRVVEPACGSGAFLGPLVARLSASCRKREQPIIDAADALRAFDLLPVNVEKARALVVGVLVGDGWAEDDAEQLAQQWVQAADYLLRPQGRDVDLVVGNPPYVRLEDVPDARMRAYRATCASMTGRSDLYVGFFERALRSLRQGGQVGFICADRWMRNQYGRHLRGLVTDGFSVDVIVAMHDVDAFEDQVSAYPAVTVISRRPQQSAVVADTTAMFGAESAPALADYSRGDSTETVTAPSFQVSRLPHWFAGDESWPAGSPARLAMIEHLTEHFPPLEDPATRTRVGIGVATGADGVFITTRTDVAEPDRMLPLSMVSDIASGRVEWSGHYLVNPWDDEGLVRLQDHPRLFGYYEAHAEALRRRNVAERQPHRWYRTIDRVIPGLKDASKLLIPDMRMTMHPVLDEGCTYPHHNLYFVTSQGWDLRVLGGLLLSRVATAFVEAFCVKMRGGTLRFQAQYLRRIRVPRIDDVSAEDAAALAEAFDLRDVDAATSVALRLYGLDSLPE